MLRTLLAGALGALTLGLPAVSRAAVVIAPVDAIVAYGGDAGAEFAITNVFDQSGLTEGYDSELTDFDAYLAAEPFHSASGAGREWFSALGQRSARITFDLGGLFALQHLALWNEEAGGVGRLKVFVGDRLLADVAPTDHPAGARFYGADRVDFGSVTTRYVTLELSDCGDVYAGCSLGEVVFGGGSAAQPVPEPSAWVVMVLGFGLAGAAMRARRSRVVAAR